MEKLLDGLTGKAKLECEEAHRLYMCAMNGKLKYLSHMSAATVSVCKCR